MKAREDAKHPIIHETKNVSVPNVHRAKAGKPGNTQAARRPVAGPVPGPISELYMHPVCHSPTILRSHDSFIEKGAGTEGKPSEKRHMSVSGGAEIQAQGRGWAPKSGSQLLSWTTSPTIQS